MLWRHTPRPRGGRRLPEGFVEPCRPVLSTKVPSAPGWIHEVKYDGYRLICRNGAQVRIWTRPGNEVSGEFGAIAGSLMALPHDLVLDGEAVCPRGNSYDFHALRSKRGRAAAIMWAFDLLMLDGEDLRPLPCIERRARLQPLIGKCSAILFSDAMSAGDGQALFDHACRHNLEGIISKRADSPYRSGPQRTWLKIKCEEYVR